jgi:predicted dehydrogenase
MTDSVVKIGLAGIGGYGERYLEALLPRLDMLRVKIVGAVDPYPQRCRHLRELQAAKVPLHNSFRSLFASSPIDLMLIVTPIHLHAAHTCHALQQGMNVLCEKPLAGTLADAIRMAETQAAAKSFAAIGYQWSFSQAVQSLKADIMAGVLGRPIRMKAMVFFPRPVDYFRRNDWAGRLHTLDGQGVFDSPVNNAAAHYLHNMFYVLGSTRDTSAMPRSVQAELYRGNDIESFDTAAIRCRTDNDVEVLFYTSHAAPEHRGPRSRYDFENAVVDFDALATGQFIARFRDGRVKHYGHPNLDRHEKIWQSIESVRTGKPIACGIAAALPHALCVAAAHESSPQIIEFPQRLRKIASFDGEAMIAIDDLAEQFTTCYEAGVMPSELPTLDWARPGAIIEPAQLDALTASADGNGKAAGVNGDGNGQTAVANADGNGNGHRVSVTLHPAPAAVPWTQSPSH